MKILSVALAIAFLALQSCRDREAAVTNQPAARAIQAPSPQSGPTSGDTSAAAATQPAIDVSAFFSAVHVPAGDLRIEGLAYASGDARHSDIAVTVRNVSNSRIDGFAYGLSWSSECTNRLYTATPMTIYQSYDFRDNQTQPMPELKPPLEPGATSTLIVDRRQYNATYGHRRSDGCPGERKPEFTIEQVVRLNIDRTAP